MKSKNWIGNDAYSSYECAHEQKSEKKSLVKFGMRDDSVYVARAPQPLKLLNDAYTESHSVGCTFKVVKNKLTVKKANQSLRKLNLFYNVSRKLTCFKFYEV